MTTDKTGAETNVTHLADENRYQISVDGRVAGLTAYRDRDHDGSAERVFYHTEVGPDFGGRGLATILVQEALDDSIAAGKLIVPVCPMVRHFLSEHTDYAEKSRKVTPDDINWIQSVTT
ncbi:GNAT family N-acetyltransferase [Gordonia sputi]|uniref:N-acetyltransferase domain-containing protein n=1 Tax=Gordonia sputi NBRC 100414 TaxID=1089453 RepID=H5TXW7_9ACTN|nr:GNAT family N-acetyltransferase [Gordonia sputi]NKY91929.1 N-acetyltransferase [Gordonia sputi]GAB38325.1 hypothetical protein GOSPT_042_00750 [Gordonia sputi NBRC 100414]